jgi:UDP-2,3-diacylglucosamine pyrophosphatase LpxH
MNILDLEVQTEPVDVGRWRLYPVGDLHLDEKSTDRKRLKRYLEHIAADPYSIWVLVGDLISGTTPSHGWFTVEPVAADVLVNMDRYVAYTMLELEHTLQPLVGRPGIVIQGNHDLRRGIQWSGLCWEIARRLNDKSDAPVLYGGDECLVRVRARENRSKGSKSKPNCWLYTVHAHHGAGGGMYPGGKINRFENTVGKLTDADILVRGHVHDSDIRIVPIYTVTRKGKARLKERQRAFVTAGSFAPARTEGVNDYASRKGYPPNDQGIMYLNIALPARHSGHDGKMWRSELPI